jgi:hypothetical protein
MSLSGREYLEAVKDLLAERDAEIQSIQEWLRAAILQAEEAYNTIRLGPVKFADKARALGGRNGDLLLSYLYRWHEEDYQKQLDLKVDSLQEEYNDKVSPIIQKYQAKIDARLGTCT